MVFLALAEHGAKAVFRGEDLAALVGIALQKTTPSRYSRYGFSVNRRYSSTGIVIAVVLLTVFYSATRRRK
jgi:hypothetical protein